MTVWPHYNKPGWEWILMQPAYFCSLKALYKRNHTALDVLSHILTSILRFAYLHFLFSLLHQYE